MTRAMQLPRSDALIRGLMHARSGRRRYMRVLTLAEEKVLGTLIAGAARAGFALSHLEDDDGMELLLATRGAETIRFENREQVGAWLNGLHAALRHA